MKPKMVIPNYSKTFADRHLEVNLEVESWLVWPGTSLHEIARRLETHPLITFIPMVGHEDWPYWSQFFQVEDQR